MAVSFAQTLLGGGLMATLLTNQSIGKFTNIASTKPEAASSSSMSTTVIIVIIVIALIIEVLLLVSTYKLTNSVLQTVLCLLFSCFYLIMAYIYYGMSGYKFSKK